LIAASITIRNLDDDLKRRPRIRAARRPISQSDCRTAAIARAQGASVATRNTRDHAVCGVAVIDPWE